MQLTPWWNRSRALSPRQIEKIRLRVCAIAMLGGSIGTMSALATHNYGWAAISAAVFAAGVISFD